MQIKLTAILFAFALAAGLGGGTAQAQYMRLGNTGTIALKSGETLDLGRLYWVTNCRSILTATPQVEILEGPPQVSLAVKEEMILPRREGCARKVSGGILTITAKEIDDPSFTHLTLRVLYKTKDGDRKWSHVVNLQLIP